MLHDAHTKMVSIPVAAEIGSNTLVAAQTDAYIYVHELIGDLSADGNVVIKAGTRTLGSFTLDAGQGLTEQDIAGMDGVPRFECKPGEAFIVETTGGTFHGSLAYSLRY